MKILIFGGVDHAGARTQIARAINDAAGGAKGAPRALCVAMRAPGFGIPTDVVLYPDGPVLDRDAASRVRTFGRDADVIASIGDGDYVTFFRGVQTYVGRSVWSFPVRIGFHAGSTYRQDHERYDAIDAQMFHMRLLNYDLVRLSTVQNTFGYHHPVQIPLPVSLLRWGSWSSDHPMVVSHTPSNREAKGSDVIDAVVQDVRAVCPHIEYHGESGVTWAESIAIKGRSHIYIDELNPRIGAANRSIYEAAHLGCLVLSGMHGIPEAARVPGTIAVLDWHALRQILIMAYRGTTAVDWYLTRAAAWCRNEGSFRSIGQWFIDRIRTAGVP